jgi:hypothetical protein
MAMTKIFITAALAAAGLAAAGAPAQAQARLDTGLASRGDVQLLQVRDGGCYQGERSSNCRERTRAEHGSHHHYVWRNGRYEDDGGGVVAGSILGFALGAAIAGSQNDRAYYDSHRRDRQWVDSCRSSYHGWDSGTGTYLGDDGSRHYCTR